MLGLIGCELIFPNGVVPAKLNEVFEGKVLLIRKVRDEKEAAVYIGSSGLMDFRIGRYSDYCK